MNSIVWCGLGLMGWFPLKAGMNYIAVDLNCGWRNCTFKEFKRRFCEVRVWELLVLVVAVSLGPVAAVFGAVMAFVTGFSAAIQNGLPEFLSAPSFYLCKPKADDED